MKVEAAWRDLSRGEEGFSYIFHHCNIKGTCWLHLKQNVLLKILAWFDQGPFHPLTHLVLYRTFSNLMALHPTPL